MHKDHGSQNHEEESLAAQQEQCDHEPAHVRREWWHELVKVAALGFALAEVVDRARERIAALERDCAQLETAHLCPDCEKQVVWDNEQCPNCGACGH